MAKTSKNILGDQSGKIGKIVGRVVNGIQLYSAYNSHTSNPRTPKQIAARARFTAVMRLSKAMIGAANIGFRLTASGVPLTSPSNIFTKRNNKFMQYDPDTKVTTPDYEHLILSEGHTPYVEFSNVSFSDSQSVKVSISSPLTSDFGAYDDDTVYIVVYCVPPNWVGENVYVWGFVKTSVDEPLLIESIGVRLRPGECSPTSYIATGAIS